MSNFEKVAIRGEPQLPLKFLPEGTLLFTYGELRAPMVVQAAYAEQLRQTGQFQNISWNAATNNYVICFSNHVNKPLYFSPFPGLGFGIAGRTYNIAHVCRTTTDMWVGHMRSGTLMEATTYKKPRHNGPQLPENRRILRCEPQVAQVYDVGCVPAGRVGADYCVARQYGMDNKISGTATIDPVDCIVDDGGADRLMFVALRNFYNAARAQGFPPNFREMWDTMMLGISADRNNNNNRNSTGYEEYVINTPYGYENYTVNDFIPDTIIGIVANVYPDRKIFRVPEARLAEFMAECRKFKKPYIDYEASATVNGIIGAINNLPPVHQNMTYLLNMNLWTIVERYAGNADFARDLNYLPNKGILCRTEPSIEDIIANPPGNILLNTLNNAPRDVRIADLWKVKELNNDPQIEDTALYRVLKIVVGDRVALSRNSLEHVLINTPIGQKSIQVGPVNEYFSGRRPVLPPNDQFDSINALRLLLNRIEIDPAFRSHVHEHSRLPLINYLRTPGALVVYQRSIDACPGPRPMPPLVPNGGGMLRKSRNTRVKKTKSKKRMIRTRKNHHGGADEDKRSERVYEAEALTGETFELAKKLEKYMLEDSLIGQKEYLARYTEAKRLQAIIDARVSTTNTPAANTPNTNTPNTNTLAMNRNAAAAAVPPANTLAMNRNAPAAAPPANTLAMNRNAPAAAPPANTIAMNTPVRNTIL